VQLARINNLMEKHGRHDVRVCTVCDFAELVLAPENAVAGSDKMLRRSSSRSA